MAVDVCSEISSPRISFSHDLKELDSVPVESHHSRSDALLLNPSIDFDFCIDRSEISSADELFSNGRILPVEIKKTNPPKQIHHTEPRKNNEFGDGNTKKKRLIEFLSTSFDEEESEKPIAKTFWQFRRSSSVNSTANGLIGRSLQFLTRSNSTGSVPNPKVMQKQHSLKESSINRRNSSASGFHQYYPYNNSNNSKRPFLRTSSTSSRSYGNGVRIINPVLNIPPTNYIAKGTVSLFGIGSFFCSKKSKKKRK
ncbi:hypothetical protein ACS0TY_008354 [Phlomoides rotata]